jgi:thioredoxin reductase
MARPVPAPAMLDVCIVGAGPAGLSAALMLGRCRRRVVTIDAGRPRNGRARELHGFLSRDGIAPHALLALGREQLAPYATVRVEEGEVVHAECEADGTFRVALADGRELRARKLLLATGVVDALPALAGLDELYGTSVHHCPYCDGWEQRDRELAAYGKGKSGHGLALELRAWSADVVLFSDGPAGLDEAQRADLARAGVKVVEERIERLVARNGSLRAVLLADGRALARDALFLGTENHQAASLAERLGCGLTHKGAVATGADESTRVPGLYVAGDASGGEQLVVVAAAEAVKAAIAIHRELAAEERRSGG